MATSVRWIWNTRVPTWTRARGIPCCIPRVLFAERVSGTLRKHQLQARCACDVIGGNLAVNAGQTAHVPRGEFPTSERYSELAE